MNAATPPQRCALATAWRATVVLPLDSGPKIPTTRPRGRPPMPGAHSSAIEPVGITSTGALLSSPRRMREPVPNWRSSWARAASSALSRSAAGAMGAIAVLGFRVLFIDNDARSWRRQFHYDDAPLWTTQAYLLTLWT